MKYSKSLMLYQNPDDFPPGGLRTFIVARGPSLSNSSAQIKLKKINFINFKIQLIFSKKWN